MSANTETEAFYREVDERHLVPLWNITESQLTTEPRSPVKAHLWRWADLRRLAHQAGDLVPLERGGERRVLGLVNPGLGGKPAATRTLWAAVQIVKPGEIAPCHRHSPSAIRFIIEGDRTYTNLNGDKCVMSRGDLVLTPNWDWHDHGCESDEPMIWMDGLDLPLVGDLDATFFEMYPDHRFPITDVNESERKFGVTHLRPTWEKPPEHRSPLLNFKWEPTYDALQRIGEGAASPPRRRLLRVPEPEHRRPGAAHHELHHPDGPARRPHPGPPAGAELGLPGLQRKGLLGHQRRTVRLGGRRLFRGAPVGLARARQRHRRRIHPVRHPRRPR